MKAFGIKWQQSQILRISSHRSILNHNLDWGREFWFAFGRNRQIFLILSIHVASHMMWCLEWQRIGRTKCQREELIHWIDIVEVVSSVSPTEQAKPRINIKNRVLIFHCGAWFHLLFPCESAAGISQFWGHSNTNKNGVTIWSSHWPINGRLDKSPIVDLQMKL